MKLILSEAQATEFNIHIEGANDDGAELPLVGLSTRLTPAQHEELYQIALTGFQIAEEDNNDERCEMFEGLLSALDDAMENE